VFSEGAKVNRLGLSAAGVLLTVLMIVGCSQNNDSQITDSFENSDSLTQQGVQQEQLDLLLPTRIEVLPFTKAKSWDNDQKLDGLEVVLRPLDSFGDQTKAIGLFRFELFLFEKASSDSRGPRIGFWEEDVTSREMLEIHWDRITRTYRFRLGWVGKQIPSGKYVLEVTYITPYGQRLSDTYVMEACVSREQIKEKAEQKAEQGLKLF
jgi:hypothetical protein